MNVVLTTDLCNGGAAIACRRLRDGLRVAGCSAEWIAVRGRHPKATALEGYPDFLGLCLNRIAGRFACAGVCEAWARRRTWRRALRNRRPALVNCHNLHDALPFAALGDVPKDVPICLTLHDMWAISGYCCYSYDCDKFVAGCKGVCPQVGKWGKASCSPSQGWQQRQAFIEANRERVALVAPSRWLADLAKKRFGEIVRVDCIPNGLDTAVFRPLEEKTAVRKILGLDPSAHIILAGSQYPGDPRKDAASLVKAVADAHATRGTTIQVVMFGAAPDNCVPDDWIRVGPIGNEDQLNLYYNAADVFVHTSHADNLPNTLVEAIAAGTPCVTSAVGGCAEIVRDGKTGFVARKKDVEHLASCICCVLAMSAGEAAAMSQRCRDVALAEYSLERQAKAYLQLFEELSDSSGVSPIN